MRWLLSLLLILLLWLQVRLWIGEGSLAHMAELDRQVEAQQQENKRLNERNQRLAAEVLSLKHNLDSIEEKARQDLGMIRDGETFYLLVEEDNQ